MSWRLTPSFRRRRLCRNSSSRIGVRDRPRSGIQKLSKKWRFPGFRIFTCFASVVRNDVFSNHWNLFANYIRIKQAPIFRKNPKFSSRHKIAQDKRRPHVMKALRLFCRSGLARELRTTNRAVCEEICLATQDSADKVSTVRVCFLSSAINIFSMTDLYHPYRTFIILD